MVTKFKLQASPLARLQAVPAPDSPQTRLAPADLGQMEQALRLPTGDIDPRTGAAAEFAILGASGEGSATEIAGIAARSATSRPAMPSAVDSVDALARLEVGQVAQVAVNLIGENKYNARVFYLAADIDSTAVSMQKNSQLAIATGWVEGGRLLLKDGQKRARSARAGGIPYLKVEICARPDPRNGYLTSRAMNTERSDQTALDDAIRWKELLGDGVFQDQQDLANALDMTVPSVSKTLAINSIPVRLLHRMKENPITSSLRAAYELSRIFVSNLGENDPERAELIGDEVIDEMVKRSLSAEATRLLIESKVAGPRRRVRAEVAQIRFGDQCGQLKMAGDKTSLELSFRELSAEQCDRIRSAITSALDKPAAG